MIDKSLRDRYSRQTMFPGIGEEGQAKLLSSGVVIIGCGALGSNIATFLVRAGVGIIPGKTPCFRCISPILSTPETTATCETAGIVGTVPAIIGSIQATEAMKILMGKEEINRELILINVWKWTFDHVQIRSHLLVLVPRVQ